MINTEFDNRALVSLVNSSLFWIWEVDENFNFTKSNSLIEKYLGYNISEILKKNFLEIINRDDIIKIMELIHTRTNKEKSISCTVIFVHKNGSKIKFNTNCGCIIDDKNNIIGVQGMSKIIEDKSLESDYLEEIKKLTKLNNVKDLIEHP